MQQKIFTYFYPIKDSDLFHSVEENLEAMLADGWQAVSVSQSVYPSFRKDARGEQIHCQELAITVLYQKNN